MGASSLATKRKVKDLTVRQREHLAWRLDAKTACGYITACQIARLEIFTDMSLVDIFEWAGKSPRAAKTHARKVVNFL